MSVERWRRLRPLEPEREGPQESLSSVPQSSRPLSPPLSQVSAPGGLRAEEQRAEVVGVGRRGGVVGGRSRGSTGLPILGLTLLQICHFFKKYS